MTCLPVKSPFSSFVKKAKTAIGGLLKDKKRINLEIHTVPFLRGYLARCFKLKNLREKKSLRLLVAWFTQGHGNRYHEKGALGAL